MYKEKEIIYQQIHSDEYIDTQLKDYISFMNKFVDRLYCQYEFYKSQTTYVVEELPYLRAQTAYVDSIQTQFFKNRRSANDLLQNRHFVISEIPIDDSPLRMEMLQEDNAALTQPRGLYNGNLHIDCLYKVRQQLNDRLQMLQNGLLGETKHPMNMQYFEHSFNFEDYYPLNNSVVKFGNCYSPNIIAPISTDFPEKYPANAHYAPFSTNIHGQQVQHYQPFSVENEEGAKSWMESLSELRNDVKVSAYLSSTGSQINAEIDVEYVVKKQLKELQSDVNFLKYEVGQLRSLVNDCLHHRAAVENQSTKNVSEEKQLQLEYRLDAVNDLKTVAQKAFGAKQTEFPQMGNISGQVNNFQIHKIYEDSPVVLQEYATISLYNILYYPSTYTISYNNSYKELLLPSTNYQIQVPLGSHLGYKSQSKLRGLLKNCREPVNDLNQPNYVE